MTKHTERHIQIKNETLYSKTTGMKITGSNTDGFIDTGKLTFNPMFNSPPAPSEWKCYLFGNKPGDIGIIYMPTKGQVPNWFVRWMMKICFACTWVKEKK